MEDEVNTKEIIPRFISMRFSNSMLECFTMFLPIALLKNCWNEIL
jgi:hypothetical protein